MIFFHSHIDSSYLMGLHDYFFCPTLFSSGSLLFGLPEQINFSPRPQGQKDRAPSSSSIDKFVQTVIIVVTLFVGVILLARPPTLVVLIVTHGRTEEVLPLVVSFTKKFWSHHIVLRQVPGDYYDSSINDQENDGQAKWPGQENCRTLREGWHFIATNCSTIWTTDFKFCTTNFLYYYIIIWWCIVNSYYYE